MRGLTIERVLWALIALGLYLGVLHLAFRAIDHQVCHSVDVIRAVELGCFEDGILK